MLKAFNFQSFYLANTPGVNEIEEWERPRIWVPNPILPQIIYIYFFLGGEEEGGVKNGEYMYIDWLSPKNARIHCVLVHCTLHSI